MDKLSLKKELKTLGVNIVKGNYVKRSDVQKILSDKKITGILSRGKPVKVNCTLAEIETKDAHRTYTPDTYYIDYSKLPEDIKKLFEKAEPIVENSRYTVFKPIAYLLASVVTKDDAEVHLEVHLGEIEEEEKEEEEDEDYDIDAHEQNIADEMKATFDWRMQDVYFEIAKYPKEEEEEVEAKAEAKAEAKVTANVYYVTVDKKDFEYSSTLDAAKKNALEALKTNPKSDILIEVYTGDEHGSGGNLVKTLKLDSKAKTFKAVTAGAKEEKTTYDKLMFVFKQHKLMLDTIEYIYTNIEDDGNEQTKWVKEDLGKLIDKIKNFKE